MSQSQSATVKVKPADSSPPPNGSPVITCTIQASVVSAAPTSTTKITGLAISARGSSFFSGETSSEPASVCGSPLNTNSSAATNEIGSST